MTPIGKIKKIYEENGIIGTAARGLKKVSRYLVETNSAFWMERDLSIPVPKQKSAIPVELNLYSNQETIDWIKSCPEDWIYNPKEIEVGLKEGHQYPNLKHNGEIIGYAKIGIGRVYIADYKKVISLPKGTAFCYDYYIVPKYRGRFLSLYLIAETLRWAQAEGFKLAMGHIPPWNTASILIIERLKFKKRRYVRHFRFLGFIKFWYHKRFNEGKSNFEYGRFCTYF